MSRGQRLVVLVGIVGLVIDQLISAVYISGCDLVAFAG